MNKKYITKTTLKSRGWTDSKILEFFPTPHKQAPNPYSKKRAPMKLYELKIVERKEKTKKWQNWFNKTKDYRKKISDKNKINAKNKKQELIGYIEKLKIKIPKFDREDLYELACYHYNNLWAERGDYDKNADLKSDSSFLNRISVNMLRHNYSNYEEKLDKIFGKVGVDFAYIILKNKVLDKIAEVYPFLKNQCENQKILENNDLTEEEIESFN